MALPSHVCDITIDSYAVDTGVVSTSYNNRDCTAAYLTVVVLSCCCYFYCSDFDLVFMLDASRSIGNQRFLGEVLDFVVAVSEHFSLARSCVPTFQPPGQQPNVPANALTLTSCPAPPPTAVLPPLRCTSILQLLHAAPAREATLVNIRVAADHQSHAAWSGDPRVIRSVSISGSIFLKAFGGVDVFAAGRRGHRDPTQPHPPNS